MSRLCNQIKTRLSQDERERERHVLQGIEMIQFDMKLLRLRPSYFTISFPSSQLLAQRSNSAACRVFSSCKDWWCTSWSRSRKVSPIWVEYKSKPTRQKGWPGHPVTPAHLHPEPVPLRQPDLAAVPLPEEVATQLGLARREDGGKAEQVVAVVGLALKYVLRRVFKDYSNRYSDLRWRDAQCFIYVAQWRTMTHSATLELWQIFKKQNVGLEDFVFIY